MFQTDAIANELLVCSGVEEGKYQITPLKLQKLIYFCEGWFLANHHQSLTNEELQCWELGPVYPSVYHEFKEFGRQNITRKAKDASFDPETNLVTIIEPSLDEYLSTFPEEVEKARQIIQRVWTQYGNLSAGQLVDVSHAKNAPWERVVRGEEFSSGLHLPKALMEQYFVGILKNARQTVEQ